MALLLKHQTAADFIARFREAYRNADKERPVAPDRQLMNNGAPKCPSE